jgi:hypothetical protein
VPPALDTSRPVPPDTALYRRINPDPHLVWDENFDCWRISTGAFRDPEMSVVIGDTLEELARDPASVLSEHPDNYLVSFTAKVAEDCSLTVVRDSTPLEPAHGVVRGKKRKPVMRALAAACAWVVRPDTACEPPYQAIEPPGLQG